MEENGHVYAYTGKLMYGLPQIGIIANYFHTKILAPQGYYQFRHNWPMEAQM